MPRKNVLICFDAFGTLFKPKQPIAQQYGDGARALGLNGFTDDQIQESFRAAFKHEAKQNPNYGKATGLGAERWWTNIIHNTFKPFANNEQLPRELAPRLIHRFSSGEGYTMFPDVLPLLQGLRTAATERNDCLVIGIITNSDDRVPGILESLGMRISPRRYGTTSPQPSASFPQYDIDFTAMSYDVGYEKPDRRIFAAAEDMLRKTQEASAQGDGFGYDARTWQKLYVGDEYDTDVVGALNAGWTAVYIDREFYAKRTNVLWPEHRIANNPDPEAGFSTPVGGAKAFGFSSLASFAQWQLEQF